MARHRAETTVPTAKQYLMHHIDEFTKSIHRPISVTLMLGMVLALLLVALGHNNAANVRIMAPAAPTAAIVSSTSVTTRVQDVPAAVESTPVKIEAAPVAAEIAPTYSVVAGDTLGKIAARFGSTVASLAACNNISNPNVIMVGQTLNTDCADAAPAAAPAPQQSSDNNTSGARQTIVNFAKARLGMAYRYGGTSDRTGYDCSGLVQAAYAAAGISVPRNTSGQYAAGTKVSKSNLQVGDAVFFYGGSHEGIYLGDGKVIHSPKTGDVIKISDMKYMDYYGAVSATA